MRVLNFRAAPSLKQPVGRVRFRRPSALIPHRGDATPTVVRLRFETASLLNYEFNWSHRIWPKCYDMLFGKLVMRRSGVLEFTRRRRPTSRRLGATRPAVDPRPFAPTSTPCPNPPPSSTPTSSPTPPRPPPPPASATTPTSSPPPKNAASRSWLADAPFEPFDFHGYIFANRRVIGFGWRYDYSRRAVELPRPYRPNSSPCASRSPASPASRPRRSSRC